MTCTERCPLSLGGTSDHTFGNPEVDRFTVSRLLIAPLGDHWWLRLPQRRRFFDGQFMASTSSGTRQTKSTQGVRRSESEQQALERPTTLAEAAYESVAASLMEGGYVPGDRLAARTLAAQLGVSLTPAREAVLRLVSEGALELRNPRTIVVPTLSPQQFKEIYCIRHALEPTAGRIAATQLTGEDVKVLEQLLGRMTGHYARGDYRQAFRSNREFLFRIYAAAQMPLVLSFHSGGLASSRSDVSLALSNARRSGRCTSNTRRSDICDQSAGCGRPRSCNRKGSAARRGASEPVGIIVERPRLQY